MCRNETLFPPNAERLFGESTVEHRTGTPAAGSHHHQQLRRTFAATELSPLDKEPFRQRHHIILPPGGHPPRVTTPIQILACRCDNPRPAALAETHKSVILFHCSTVPLRSFPDRQHCLSKFPPNTPISPRIPTVHQRGEQLTAFTYEETFLSTSETRCPPSRVCSPTTTKGRSAGHLSGRNVSPATHALRSVGVNISAGRHDRQFRPAHPPAPPTDGSSRQLWVVALELHSAVHPFV